MAPNPPTDEVERSPHFMVRDWVVASDCGQLSRAGRIERVEPKAMEVLVYLAAHQGEVVTREELEQNVWRGALVGYDAVTKSVIKLRKAFGDQAREPSIIETLPKRGYRLVAPVRYLDADVDHRSAGPGLSEADAGPAGRTGSSLLNAQAPAAAEKPNVTATSEFQVGDWTVRPTSHALVRDGKIVQIEPKVMALLVCLAERPGQVISREQLFNSLWSGVDVGDDTLTQVVIKLRKALGDDAKSPRYLQAIPKKGYRLTAPVQAAPPSGSQAQTIGKAGTHGFRSSWRLIAILGITVGIGLVEAWAWLFSGQAPPDVQAVAMHLASGSPDGRPTISVLPFETVGEKFVGAEDQTNLAQGLTLDLITDLSKLSGLWVIGPRSILGQAPSEGAAAQARYLVFGNVQRTPGEVRIYARLIDTQTGRQLWSERYRQPPKELFNVQEQISRQIVTTLSLKITETEHRRLAQRYTLNLEAYETFLQGQSLLLVRQNAENDRARERYRHAIALDPNFGRAYAGLALTFAADYRNQWTDDPAGALERAREMAQTALQIDPEIPEVYWVLAYVSAQQRDHPKALSLLRKAISVDQSFADAYALMGGIEIYVGRPADSLALLRTAIRLNPDAGYLYFLLLGRAYFYLGDWEQARINLNEALVRNPSNLEAHVYLMATSESSGDQDTAAWEAEEIHALEPNFDPRRWLATYPMTDVKQQEQLLEALSAAGI